MKKFLALISVFALAFSLTSCADKTKTQENENHIVSTFVQTTTAETQTSTIQTSASQNLSSSGGFGSGLNLGNIAPSHNYEINDTGSFDADLNAFDDLILDFQYNLEGEDLERFAHMDEIEIQAMVAEKNEFLAELFTAFTAVGLNVQIDERSGEVTLDNSILFSGDSAVLSDRGKDFLNKFIEAYSSVLLNEKYDGFISKVLVEGHTAPLSNSTFESGLPLSRERAGNVRNYCLSSDTGLDSASIAELSSLLVAEGCSNSRPILNSDGSVNLSRSRRVTFRFIINID